ANKSNRGTERGDPMGSRLVWWRWANCARFRGAGVVVEDAAAPGPRAGSGWKRLTGDGWPMAPSRMRLWSPLIALLAVGTAQVHGQGPAQGRATTPAAQAGRTTQRAQAPAQNQGKAQPARDPAKMKWLLQKWEGQSAKLKTLDVRIYRVDQDFRWKDEVHY